MTALRELMPCFQGVVPAAIATCDASGVPNVAYVSQVYYLDEGHVALSCQFFNKTRRNIDQNPYACVKVMHPVTLDAWRLDVKFVRAESSGPLFDEMELRIQAIAAHTGMKGIFRLLSSDIYEVLDVQHVPGYLMPGSGDAPRLEMGDTRAELRGLQVLSDRVSRTDDLADLLKTLLHSLCELFRVQHAMFLMHDDSDARLYAVESAGYDTSGVGAEVALGEGLIGTVARTRRPLRVSGMAEMLRYGRAVRQEMQAEGAQLCEEIPLPGLCDAQSQLALPLAVGERLIGVLALESADPLAFQDWHEAYLSLLANQAALAIERLAERADEEPLPEPDRPPLAARRRTFTWYEKDEVVFCDGEYLVRNVPGRIFWKLLTEHSQTGRTEFANRELRMDDSLGLPAYKDNLESRLILLRKRLAERCPDVRLVPVRRGRFVLERDCELELEAR
ncbi:MAG: GAF domain-containing protein [Planctomycetes bacterium]|nr:GAF domain-containing protein [Planctomycetota bacterium]